MSGPYCETCKYYRSMSFDEEFGECYDPSKRIYDRNSNPVDDPPGVHVRYTCCNHALRGAEFYPPVGFERRGKCPKCGQWYDVEPSGE